MTTLFVTHCKINVRSLYVLVALDITTHAPVNHVPAHPMGHGAGHGTGHGEGHGAGHGAGHELEHGADMEQHLMVCESNISARYVIIINGFHPFGFLNIICKFCLGTEKDNFIHLLFY